MGEDNREPKPTFEIDGTEHTFGDIKCCSPLSKKCECGGIIHYEAVYGGEIKVCDKCARYF